MTTPLLSIVVPTKDRYETLTILVNRLMLWPDSRFELVIQDNSSDNSAFQMVLNQHQQDARLRYAFSSTPVSAIDNCDAAVARARGTFVCFIGDDDGLVIQALDAAAWMERRGIEALICNVASYTWPDMEHSVALNHMLNGRLINSDYSGETTLPSAEDELDKVFRSGARSMFNMPRLYHAIVARQVLDRLRLATGTCFPGPVPDMANAVALCSFLTSYVHVDLPLIISGQSRKSMSGKNAVRKHQGEIEKEPSLPAAAAEHWDDRVPRYWSGPTIWAEAAIKGAEATGRSDMVTRFGFATLYAGCLVYNQRKYWTRIVAAMKTHGGFRFLALWPAVLWHVAAIMALRAKILMTKKLFGIDGTDCPDMAAVIDHLEARLTESGLMQRSLGPSGPGRP